MREKIGIINFSKRFQTHLMAFHERENCVDKKRKATDEAENSKITSRVLSHEINNGRTGDWA